LRDAYVLERRPPRPANDPWRYQGVLLEDEPQPDGPPARVATVFLTGRECPWRCVMCDLWRQTTSGDTPRGAIPAQIAAAFDALGADAAALRQVKLYNAGSFFDPRAVPEADYDEIAVLLQGVRRVIVECHPSLVGRRVDRFLEALRGHHPDAPAAHLEVAMGLETAHPVALERLHKRMTLDDFTAAAAQLARRGVGLRVFLLIAPPFIAADEQDAWLLRSLDAAFECGASVVSLIPTRPGNGALDSLRAAGDFVPPSLSDVERSFERALARAAGRGRVLVDLWDVERVAECSRCSAARRDRLHAMNLQQHLLAAYTCEYCAAGEVA
jgi:radical SAM enzyme (TIGR01210 family)